MISCTTGIFVIAIPTCKINNSPRIRFHECDVYSYNGKNEVATGIKVSQRLGQCYNGSIITGCPAVEVITGNSAKNRINRARPGNDSRTGSVMPVEAEKPCISRISGKKKMHGNSIKITVHWWHIYRSWIQCTMF